jgi:hypothetical protein
MGSRGSVVDMLPTVLQQARTDVIYAAAPVSVLRPVCALARRYSLPVQALVTEPEMTCGTGLCQGCVLPVVGNDGVTRMARACTDGPVFRGESVRWDDVGTIPFDAFGAPGWKPRPAGSSSGPGASAASGAPASASGSSGSPRASGPSGPSAPSASSSSRSSEAPGPPGMSGLFGSSTKPRSAGSGGGGPGHGQPSGGKTPGGRSHAG